MWHSRAGRGNSSSGLSPDLFRAWFLQFALIGAPFPITPSCEDTHWTKHCLRKCYIPLDPTQRMAIQRRRKGKRERVRQQWCTLPAMLTCFLFSLNFLWWAQFLDMDWLFGSPISSPPPPRPTKFICWNSNPQWDGSRKWGLRLVIRSWTWISHK